MSIVVYMVRENMLNGWKRTIWAPRKRSNELHYRTKEARKCTPGRRLYGSVQDKFQSSWLHDQKAQSERISVYWEADRSQLAQWQVQKRLSLAHVQRSRTIIFRVWALSELLSSVRYRKNLMRSMVDFNGKPRQNDGIGYCKWRGLRDILVNT